MIYSGILRDAGLACAARCPLDARLDGLLAVHYSARRVTRVSPVSSFAKIKTDFELVGENESRFVGAGAVFLFETLDDPGAAFFEKLCHL